MRAVPQARRRGVLVCTQDRGMRQSGRGRSDRSVGASRRGSASPEACGLRRSRPAAGLAQPNALTTVGTTRKRRAGVIAFSKAAACGGIGLHGSTGAKGFDRPSDGGWRGAAARSGRHRRAAAENAGWHPARAAEAAASGVGWRATSRSSPQDGGPGMGNNGAARTWPPVPRWRGPQPPIRLPHVAPRPVRAEAEPSRAGGQEVPGRLPRAAGFVACRIDILGLIGGPPAILRRAQPASAAAR